MQFCKQLVFGLTFLLYGYYAHACECLPPRGDKWSLQQVRTELERSSYVFIGEVISASRGSYQVRVVELFKGAIKSDTLTGLNEHMTSCGLTVTPGLWIFYAGLNDEGYIMPLDLCSLSGSLTEPGFILIPPPPGVKPDSADQEAYIEEQLRQQLPLYLKNWLNEYALLNAYRNEHFPNTQSSSASTLPAYAALGLSMLALALVLRRQYFS
ncbi:hypothetical protein [Hymenobacter sp. CRA2]|uniref:hypothetical protein n=1 Tax=Hymenobacter sp. CRA2 TaxID=1955620 RepID=UPI001116B847|nr:hypothetical protein [Hymenobacter sp. CRA2]